MNGATGGKDPMTENAWLKLIDAIKLVVWLGAMVGVGAQEMPAADTLGLPMNAQPRPHLGQSPAREKSRKEPSR
jgi:hypothetical protein